jgi:hypothetical protein
MNRFLLCLCLLAALLAAVVATPCVADTTNGVVAEERIVSLPQDSGKWYVSVVGDPQDARYREVLAWFDFGSLLKLRNSVNYCPIATNSAMYAERYASNTPALPMVRLQNAEGVIYSQICDSDIPMTAESLNSLLSQDVKSGPKSAECLRKWLRNRRHCPGPNPDPTPGPIDPTPGPIDNGDQPVVEPAPTGPPAWLLALACLAAFMAGAGIGVVKYTKARWKAASR